MEIRSRRINQALFGLYLFGILAVYITLSVNMLDHMTAVLLIYMTLLAALLVWTVPYMLRLASRARLAPAAPVSARRKAAYFAAFAFVSLLVMLVWYAAYYPGGYISDALDQLKEIRRHDYQDWHPAWHTLFTFALPLKLTGGWFDSILLFQIVYFALGFGYMAMSVGELFGVHTACFVLAYMLLNPGVAELTIYTYKDSAFALAAMLTAVCTLRIALQGKAWYGRRGRVLFTSVCIANMTLFRHNGILFTGVLVAALFFVMDRRRWAMLFAVVAGFLVLVKGPLYACFDVTTPQQRKIEVLGLPMTVIANVVKEEPQALDERTLAFAERMAPREVWEAYDCGNFNSIKWSVDLSPVEEAKVTDTLSMALRSFMASPKKALRALFVLTDKVYAIAGEETKFFNPYVEGQNIERAGLLYELLDNYQTMVSGSFLSYIFGYVGFTNLLLIAFMLAKCDLASRAGWRKAGLCLPMLAYNFGTMLLLTGPDLRFFWYSFLVMPLMLLMLIADTKAEHDWGRQTK